MLESLDFNNLENDTIHKFPYSGARKSLDILNNIDKLDYLCSVHRGRVRLTNFIKSYTFSRLTKDFSFMNGIPEVLMNPTNAIHKQLKAKILSCVSEEKAIDSILKCMSPYINILDTSTVTESDLYNKLDLDSLESECIFKDDIYFIDIISLCTINKLSKILNVMLKHLSPYQLHKSTDYYKKILKSINNNPHYENEELVSALKTHINSMENPTPEVKEAITERIALYKSIVNKYWSYDDTTDIKKNTDKVIIQHFLKEFGCDTDCSSLFHRIADSFNRYFKPSGYQKKLVCGRYFAIVGNDKSVSHNSCLISERELLEPELSQSCVEKKKDILHKLVFSDTTQEKMTTYLNNCIKALAEVLVEVYNKELMRSILCLLLCNDGYVDKYDVHIEGSHDKYMKYLSFCYFMMNERPIDYSEYIQDLENDKDKVIEILNEVVPTFLDEYFSETNVIDCSKYYSDNPNQVDNVFEIIGEIMKSPKINQLSLLLEEELQRIK